MTAFAIAVVVGAIVAVAYAALAIRSFLRVRSQILAGVGDDLGEEATYAEQGGSFTWKAGGGVLAAVGIISALSIGGGWWYLVPFLAIGTSVAVVLAFLLDDPATAPAAARRAR